ncbi:unnamed protein product (macronuclear) [Paramecium tetraurelia]|uniref:Pectin acetylesterase n=1 Tax=Paramecium tetraurelia TaxID=5888 RepID=A0DQU8_PARTE|nr:uncharacterized protein GSPATT00002815001 [Paramecium tetraurelia]CAK85415.1 unnamed protein product [Paramecium tetraurelia]|eukprot:XP_001452812.1 hypothetical protein (macronuclear) [Paramecium tetraurelia strain d4-2]
MLIFFFQQLQCCFQLQLQFVQDERAKCLDGTLGSYYFQQGFESGQNKFIIYFEGGEFILGNTEEQFLMNAVEKTKTQQGSSLNRASAFEFDGVFSKDKIKNYYFHNWNLIHINYCDGVGFQGYKSDQVIYQSNVLYFRGELIIRSIFDHFITKFQKAEIVILSGCSVGGVAALQWEQYFSSLIPEKISILCVADSSILYDMQSMNGFNLLQQSLKIMNYIANNETQVPQKNCASDFPNQIWKCFYFQNLMHYIQQPVFIIQPFYDISFLYKYLEIKCIQDLTLNNCQKNEMDFIDHVFQTFRQVIKESLTNNSNTGSFAPSCIADWYFQRQNQLIYKLVIIFPQLDNP